MTLSTTTSILDTVGDTPLVKLIKLCTNPLVNIYVKLEFFNPSGSIKDRIVKYILEDAIRKGLLKPGGVIVENTSGNTGAAVAMFAAQNGYKAILTMPDKVSQEKQNALKVYGAEIVVTPTSSPPDSPEHYVNKARDIARNTPNSFRLDQYDNPLNPEAHYLSTGPEIWEQTGGDVDIFIAAGSTGGTVTGIGRYLKEQNPKIKVVLPDPIGSIYAHYFKTGKVPQGGNCSYHVEGIGEDHIAKAIDFSVIDDVMPFNDKQAFATARALAQEEGIFSGLSGGANVWAALEIAKTCTLPTTIVTVIPDGGIKYLSKLNDAWMQKQNLL